MECLPNDAKNILPTAGLTSELNNWQIKVFYHIDPQKPCTFNIGNTVQP